MEVVAYHPGLGFCTGDPHPGKWVRRWPYAIPTPRTYASLSIRACPANFSKQMSHKLGLLL